MEGSSNNYTFPPGFRFHPSDEELIVHYLQNKLCSRPLPASIIAEIDLYKYNPWELPSKALFGEDEWHFFSPRERKYPNGARPNRAAASGYWKATGTDKPILSSCGLKRIAVKKALVFYSGRPPKGIKTDWIMNEYRLIDATSKPSSLKASMRLDDWVLCRVRHKGYHSSSKNNCGNRGNNVGPVLAPHPYTHQHQHQGYPTTKNVQAQIANYQYKDYHLLASILVGQPISPTENVSNGGYKGSNSHASVSDDGLDQMNPQTKVTGYFDPLKRKSNEDNQYGNLISFDRKLSIENQIDDFPSKLLTTGDIDYYSQNQSKDDILNPSPADHSINFQELNELTFTGSFLR
ncbi:hypothetical protein L6164_021954 [Bauhinia variegata]|uniref:Uncharacterized protein n=1 Tax=Bauhinia variegata TaxID=167791 RepID=A0ACB9MDG6_BAUVA|nr:hypothetical protein L6164_021954 [Bauhinia variegata]